MLDAEADTAGAAAEAQVAATLTELTQVLRKYSVEQRRTPATLEELVAAGYLRQTPAPPVGKQFAISKRLEVYLADQ